jgi:hypothetical protein
MRRLRTDKIKDRPEKEINMRKRRKVGFSRNVKGLRARKDRQKKHAPRKDYSIREAAEKYAAAGLPVFPLHDTGMGGRCTCRNPDCTQPGRHPRVPEATTDRSSIRRHWAKWPAAKIGVPLGSKSGLLALIIDGAAGRKSLKQLEEIQK